jgi:CDP-paratose 2-epimerase
LRQVTGDVRDREPLTALVAGLRPQLVVHLAAQVAVTTSVANPRHDFEVNALGTFNVLEAVRVASPETVVVYASTNKVYGKLDGLAVVEEAQRYAFGDRPFGVDESQPLDFYSPYGCSKGAGDQYVRDYQRIYGLRTVLLRLSCIYGPRQFGVEDQGWLAWFAIAAMLGRAVTLCGDGKQVRDVLYVDDLVEAILAAYQRVDRVAGVPLNLGGGPARALAVWSEYAPLLQQLAGCLPVVTLADWRPGDQRIYVSDIRRAEQLLGWVPRIDPATGAERMIRWVKDHRQVIASVLVV